VAPEAPIGFEKYFLSEIGNAGIGHAEITSV
jgi:hypothetical protein